MFYDFIFTFYGFNKIIHLCIVHDDIISTYYGLTNRVIFPWGPVFFYKIPFGGRYAWGVHFFAKTLGEALGSLKIRHILKKMTPPNETPEGIFIEKKSGFQRRKNVSVTNKS